MINPDLDNTVFSSGRNAEIQALTEKRRLGTSHGMSFWPMSKSLTFLYLHCIFLLNNFLILNWFGVCLFVCRNDEEEEDRPERPERGTKVKRTLSSLRNRMTGSFNKDKVIKHTYAPTVSLPWDKNRVHFCRTMLQLLCHCNFLSLLSTERR